MRCTNPPRQLSRTAFVSELDALTAVYAAAMRPDPEQLPGRRSIMEQHASYRGFRALAMVADDFGGADGPFVTCAPGGPREACGPGGPRETCGPGGPREACGPGGPREACGPGESGRPGQVIGFGYGFSGAAGQWWHDVVAAALTARTGAAVAAAWLADSLEIAEVHVHPDFHRRGIGRSLLLGLAEGRRERTAVLSTQDANSPARLLYRGLGFTDLLIRYSFPGSAVPYAVMGAALPLRPAAAPAKPGPGWPAEPGGPGPRVPATGRSPGWPASR